MKNLPDGQVEYLCFHTGITVLFLCFSKSIAYNPEDVTSVWVIENGLYVEFILIESRFKGKDLVEIQEIQTSQRDIIKSAARDNLQAQINLAQHIEAIAGSVGTHKDIHMKNIRSTRKREQMKNHQDYMKERVNYG